MITAIALWFRRRFGKFVKYFFLFEYNFFCRTETCTTFLGVKSISVLNWSIKKWCDTLLITILARSFYFCIYFCIMRHSGERPRREIWVLLLFTTGRGMVFGVSILLTGWTGRNSKPGVGSRFYYLKTRTDWPSGLSSLRWVKEFFLSGKEAGPLRPLLTSM